MKHRINKKIGRKLSKSTISIAHSLTIISKHVALQFHFSHSMENHSNQKESQRHRHSKRGHIEAGEFQMNFTNYVLCLSHTQFNKTSPEKNFMKGESYVNKTL